ncbi:rolling circle replication-associated protein [Methanosarcina sp. T3]|uniref:rolling circle replication-associated protein n=1 Tax=Methanosarcina sp. T3 TaxID=3439062 RepID=UPI003F8415DF
MKKEDSILWIRANPQKPLTLIFDKQISAETKIKSGEQGKTYKNFDDLEGLKNASPERWKAAHKVSRCNGFGYTDRETGDFIYTNSIYFECIQLFSDYISRIRTENIEMAYSMDGDPVFARSVALPYKTRFTSMDRQNEIKEAYRSTWTTASKRHMKAVFLTLTAPPRAGSLWDTNINMLKAWGKLRRFLDSFLARGLTYICVREFQQNGRLHFHIIIFGTNWLLPIKALKKIWVSYGGGPVMDICALRQTPEGWTWARRSPRDAAGKAPAGYLSDYLEKSMSPKSGLNYWIYNIQFWTASQDIKQAPERYESKGIWAKVGVLSKEGKRIFQKGNDTAKAFFSGALLRTRKRSEPKPDKPKEKEEPSVSFRRASELFMQG